MQVFGFTDMPMACRYLFIIHARMGFSSWLHVSFTSRIPILHPFGMGTNPPFWHSSVVLQIPLLPWFAFLSIQGMRQAVVLVPPRNGPPCPGVVSIRYGSRSTCPFDPPRGDPHPQASRRGVVGQAGFPPGRSRRHVPSSTPQIRRCRPGSNEKRPRTILGDLHPFPCEDPPGCRLPFKRNAKPKLRRNRPKDRKEETFDPTEGEEGETFILCSIYHIVPYLKGKYTTKDRQSGRVPQRFSGTPRPHTAKWHLKSTPVSEVRDCLTGCRGGFETHKPLDESRVPMTNVSRRKHVH